MKGERYCETGKNLKPSGPLTDKRPPHRLTLGLAYKEEDEEDGEDKEEEEEGGHLTGRRCSPSTVFFRGKGQRTRREGTPADCNH